MDCSLNSHNLLSAQEKLQNIYEQVQFVVTEAALKRQEDSQNLWRKLKKKEISDLWKQDFSDGCPFKFMLLDFKQTYQS